MAQSALILVDRGKESGGLAATGHQRYPNPFYSSYGAEWLFGSYGATEIKKERPVPGTSTADAVFVPVYQDSAPLEPPAPPGLYIRH